MARREGYIFIFALVAMTVILLLGAASIRMARGNYYAAGQQAADAEALALADAAEKIVKAVKGSK